MSILKINVAHKTRDLFLTTWSFFDLVDLWVIKIKSLWSFAHVVRRDHVNRARNADTQREYAKGLFYSQDYMIIKHGRHIFWEINEVRKGMWDFFFIGLFGCWLAGQTNSDHVGGVNLTEVSGKQRDCNLIFMLVEQL